MSARAFAFYGGITMLVISLLALIFPGSPAGMYITHVDISYGMFLGYFPANILNKLVLLIFGVSGLLIHKNHLKSVRYCKVVVVFMGLGALLGLIPVTSAMWGYLPLYGGEVMLHALFAIWAGFSLLSRRPLEPIPQE